MLLKRRHYSSDHFARLFERVSFGFSAHQKTVCDWWRVIESVVEESSRSSRWQEQEDEKLLQLIQVVLVRGTIRLPWLAENRMAWHGMVDTETKTALKYERWS